MLNAVEVHLQSLHSGALLRVARRANDLMQVARTATAQDRLYTTSRLAQLQLMNRATPVNSRTLSRA